MLTRRIRQALLRKRTHLKVALAGTRTAVTVLAGIVLAAKMVASKMAAKARQIRILIRITVHILFTLSVTFVINQVTKLKIVRFESTWRNAKPEMVPEMGLVML